MTINISINDPPDVLSSDTLNEAFTHIRSIFPTCYVARPRKMPHDTIMFQVWRTKSDCDNRCTVNIVARVYCDLIDWARFQRQLMPEIFGNEFDLVFPGSTFDSPNKGK